MAIDTRTPQERAYDALRDGSAYVKPATDYDTLITILERIEEHFEDDEPPPATPGAVQVTPHQADGCTWTDYEIGDIILGKLDAGHYPPSKGPWQLIMHGCEIEADAPITFDMLGKLMIDLSQLLADDRVRAAFGESPLMESVNRQLATLAAPAVQAIPRICDAEQDPARVGQVIWTDYVCDAGGESVEVFVSTNHEDRNAPMVFLPGEEGIPFADVAKWMPALNALLRDPRVQQAVAEWEAVKARQETRPC